MSGLESGSYDVVWCDRMLLTETELESGSEQQSRRALQSWKEIASYLGATVRSVQRWEDAGLPVHRQGSGQKARVYAWQDELDKWQAEGGLRRAPVDAPESLGRRHVWTLLGVGALVLIGVGVAWLAGVFPGRRVPATWTLEGLHLRVLDAQGRICWEKVLPPFHPSYLSEVTDKVVIGDVDGDDKQEVLVNLLAQDLADKGGQLACYEQDGRLRWQVRHGAAKTFGKRTFEHIYRGRFLRLVRSGGRPSVLAVANHYLWYPSQTALLDPWTGKVLEEYWHPGAVHHCIVHDLDGDGKDEVLLGAINNPGDGVGHAALAVLRLPFSRGARRETDPAWPAVTGGGEAGYALFPVPDSLSVAGLFPLIADLHVDPSDRIILLAQLQESSGIVYTLDRSLQVVDHRFSDNFAPIHDRLFRQGLLDHPLSPKEIAALGRVARFAAAPDGNSPALESIWRY